MRVPGRLNISWVDDNTLKVEMDAGTQTRLLRFGQARRSGAAHAAGPLGGNVGDRRARRRLRRRRVVVAAVAARRPRRGGDSCKRRDHEHDGRVSAVEPQHLQRERHDYRVFRRRTQDFGTDYLTVVTSIEDGGGQPRIVSSTFKKEPNGSKFKPTGCEVVR